MTSDTAPAPAAHDTPPAPSAFDRWLGIATAVPLFGIVTLTFFDVFARYLFAAPIRGSLEIIQFAMAIVIFTALPLVTRSREHVTVSLIEGLVKTRTARRLKQLACDTLSLLAVSLIAWRLWVQAGEDLASDTRTIVLRWSMAYLGYFMAVFATISAAIIAVQIWRALTHRDNAP